MDLRPLPPLLAKKAIDELGEDPRRIQADIDALRNWAQKQPYLKARTSDQFLIAFLRGSKYSLERAKEKLDKFYSLRAGIEEIFKDRKLDDPKVIEILKLGITLHLPLTNGEDGARIAIFRVGAYDPDKYTFGELVKVGSIIADIQLLEDDSSVVAGLVQLIDLAQVTPKHILHLDMRLMKKLSIYTENAMPIRQKGFHFVNTPTGFYSIFNIFKTFFSEKLKSRLFVHGNDMEALYQHIPKKLLPLEYGGENGTTQDIIETWLEKFLYYRDYFIEEQNYGTDEKFRIGGKLDFDAIFGIDGSFRKLEVD